jgi:uncharacterized protein YodC (DUF2158 family)
MKEQFREGDKVRLRDGGESMVIDHLQATFAVCMVVTPEGLQTRLYPLSMLVHAQEEDSRPAPLT